MKIIDTISLSRMLESLANFYEMSPEELLWAMRNLRTRCKQSTIPLAKILWNSPFLRYDKKLTHVMVHRCDHFVQGEGPSHFTISHHYHSPHRNSQSLSKPNLKIKYYSKHTAVWKLFVLHSFNGNSKDKYVSMSGENYKEASTRGAVFTLLGEAWKQDVNYIQKHLSLPLDQLVLLSVPCFSIEEIGKKILFHLLHILYLHLFAPLDSAVTHHEQVVFLPKVMTDRDRIEAFQVEDYRKGDL